MKHHFKQHGIIQDLSELMSKAGFSIESYENSMRITHKFFDFAIFIHKGWVRFSNIFRTKLNYNNLVKFVKRIVTYIYKTFKIKLENNLKKFEIIVKQFLKDNNINEIKPEEKLSRLDKRRLEMIQQNKKIFKEIYNYVPKKIENAKYQFKIVGTNLFFKINGLMDFKFDNGKIRVYKLSTLPNILMNEIIDKFMEHMKIKKSEVRQIQVVERGHPDLINNIGIF